MRFEHVDYVFPNLAIFEQRHYIAFGLCSSGMNKWMTHSN